MTFNRFRWVFCQLETLRNCLPQNVRRVLRDLPNSLDETYERMLREIGRVNPQQACRLLQCLAVATRPLRVDELSEVLALDFDRAEEGIPALNKDWRWDDQQQGVLSTCSSLIVIVDGLDDDFSRCRVVQFAHFSVKEFLTSDRLSNLKADISSFHIRLEPAHTVLSQACLAILLHNDRAKSSSPLSNYAARHWVDHARFENVSLRVEDGMRRLFDPAKAYFTAWLESFNMDEEWTAFYPDGPPVWSSVTSLGFRRPQESTSSSEDIASLCLYYAAFCGFRDLTKHLIAEYSQHVNARVGRNKSPLAAALRSGHIQVAELLHQHGAVLHIGSQGRTLLHAASNDGLMDVAQWLLNIGADANAQEDDHTTPLHLAAANGHLELVRTLLGHTVDVNAATTGFINTPLNGASRGGHVDVVRLLIQNGANVNAEVGRYWTPLHCASASGNVEIVQLLIQHGADVNTWDENHQKPLHVASSRGAATTVQLLIQLGADVNARDKSQSTPLHLASSMGDAETMQVLIQHGADVNARDKNQSTPLHLASSDRRAEHKQLLTQLEADVNARDKDQSTPLHLASSDRDVNARNGSQSTPLHLASLSPKWTTETFVRLLIKAGVNASNGKHKTPLHRLASSQRPNADSLRLLLENGAAVDVENDKGLTPFQIASSEGNHEIAQLLLDHRA
jgi:ankyrin repeat protein